MTVTQSPGVVCSYTLTPASLEHRGGDRDRNNRCEPSSGLHLVCIAYSELDHDFRLRLRLGRRSATSPIAANASTNTRSAAITIGGNAVSVVQAAASTGTKPSTPAALRIIK